MTLRAFLHWLITDWSFLLVTPSAEFLSRLPSPLHHHKSHGEKNQKQKQSSKQQTPTPTIRCCQPPRFSTCACVKASGHQPTHGTRLQTNTRTHTHTLAYTGPAHLCRTPPPFRSILLRSVCSSSVLEVSVGCEERVGQTDGEEE